MVVKENNSWYVKSKEGKNLGGPYNSEEEAQSRLIEVEAFKAMTQKGTKR